MSARFTLRGLGLGAGLLLCLPTALEAAESGQLAVKLREKGFTKVTVLDEGLGYWRSKDYGVQRATP